VTTQAKQLHTIEEAAERLHVTPRMVRRLVQERRIPFLRVGRHIRLSAPDLERFLADSRVEALS